MFEPVKKVLFSESSVVVEFKVRKRPKNLSLDEFTIDGDVAVPLFYSQGGVSEDRVFIDEFQTKSIFLHMGRLMKKGISISDGEVNLRIPESIPDEMKVFLAYATTVNVLNDADNRHVRKLFDKKVKLHVNGKPLKSLMGGVHGLMGSIETLFNNLDKTMTSYFKEQLGKSNVFSVKFLPVSIRVMGQEATGTGVLEVRFRAKDGSLYTRNYGVRYGVIINVGEGFIEDDSGNPVSVRRVLSSALIVGGSTIDDSSMLGLLRRYTHGTITVERFMRVADPEFFVSTLTGSAYVEPSEFHIKRGQMGLNFLVTFEKKHANGGIGDFGVTDLIKEASFSVKVSKSPLRAYPTFLLKAGDRRHLITSTGRKFLASVIAGLLLNQSIVELNYVKPKKFLILSGDSKISSEKMPLFIGSEPVGIMSVKGLKEYVTQELPSEPEKFARLPKSFPFKGILHVGIPHRTKVGVIIPLMTPDEIEESSRVYIYSLLVLNNKFIPLRLSTSVELVEIPV